MEEFFEVFTDDLEKARAHLSPGFAAQLIDFSRTYQKSEKYIAAAFRGRKFYMAIDLPHSFLSFDVGNQPLNAADNAIHRALSDLMIPRKIIDSLLGPD